MGEGTKDRLSGSIRGFRRRGLHYSGVTMLLFPVWYPMVEESGPRWPRADDALLYTFMIGVGLLFIWFAQRDG